MFKIGCHLSSSKGYLAMGKTALQIKANTFQFFSRNPRGGKAKDIKQNDIDGLKEIITKHNFAPILTHAPYVLNPCAAKEHIRDFGKTMMIEDLKRLDDYLPNNMYVMHPGNHVQQGVERGLELIVDFLDEVLENCHKTWVLLESMAGAGTEIGKSFEELAHIIKTVKKPNLLGICLDTCHSYSAGYDFVNDLDGLINEFDKLIGLDKLKAIHLNDSLNPFQSYKDRHAPIGEGSLGLETITKIITHPKLKNLPFYLETPQDTNGHAQEISLLRNMYQKNNFS